jgi:hypothetical protein
MATLDSMTLLAQAGQHRAGGVRLPAGGGNELGERGALLALQGNAFRLSLKLSEDPKSKFIWSERLPKADARSSGGTASGRVCGAG